LVFQFNKWTWEQVEEPEGGTSTSISWEGHLYSSTLVLDHHQDVIYSPIANTKKSRDLFVKKECVHGATCFTQD
jgi:hypothetical protein